MVQTIVKKRTRREKSGTLNVRSTSEKILFGIVFSIFFLQSLLLIFPVLWLFVSSLKTSDEYIFNNAFSMPAKLQWGNYIAAFTKLEVNNTNFLGMVFNSIWYTGISTALGIYFPACTGYVMSRYRFRGREVIYTVVITAMMLPVVGTSAASMRFVATLGLYDTPLYIVYRSIDGFSASFLVFYGFFKSISWSYAEAVQIDGGGPFTIFYKIMLPQAAPVLLTYAITNSITWWNSYADVTMYIPSYPTVASGLFAYKSIVTRTGQFTTYYAGLFISMIPALAIFATFSGRIMGSISIGGLKG